jgi:hypothetical protein
LSQNANADKVTFGNPYNLFELRSNRLKNNVEPCDIVLFLNNRA